MRHKQPALTVDAVVFDRDGRLLLVERRNPPFKGCWALPGGFVDYGETTEAAVAREVREETSLKIGRPRLIGVYSQPDRDPRGHTVSVAYLVVEARTPRVRGGDDARTAAFVADWRRLKLAFDHRTIVRDAVALIARS